MARVEDCPKCHGMGNIPTIIAGAPPEVEFCHPYKGTGVNLSAPPPPAPPASKGKRKRPTIEGLDEEMREDIPVDWIYSPPKPPKGWKLLP